MGKNNVTRITYAAMLIAVSVVLTRFLSLNIPIAGIIALKTNLGFIPIMLSSLMLGPVFGGAVGAVSDVAGYLINPAGGAYFPGFTATSALVGVIPYLLCFKYKKNVFVLAAAVFITTIIASLLNTLWLVILFNKSFSILIIPRLISALVMCPVYTFFVYSLKGIMDKFFVKRIN